MAENKSVFKKLFPASKEEVRGTRDYNALELRPRGAIDPSIEQLLDPNKTDLISGEDSKYISALPEDRVLRYGTYDIMAADPTIDTAIRLHVANALSAREGTGEIINIESTTDKEDPITKDLRDTFKEILNQNLQGWAYNAAKYGIWYLRPYGEEGKGVTLVRSDYYCHPRFINMYERAGQLVGYTAAYQKITGQHAGVDLIEPWKFVPVRMPIWDIATKLEPTRFDDDVFDIASDNYMEEGIVETTNYGRSLIKTAYGPWVDLQNALMSLNMSRKNAARLERLIGVNTGMLSPERAAQYLNQISDQLLKSSRDHAKAALTKGFVQTVENRIIPIWGDSRGRLDVSTVEGTPNIDGIADVMFHIQRLGGSVAVDPSLLGFGELLSGGLGDGGFFRVSALAASISQSLKTACMNAIEQLFNLHIALKYNKYFPPGQRPWRIIFNSTASALDQEQMQNYESQVNAGIQTMTLVQMIDPQASGYDPNALANYLMTDKLKMDEEKFKAIFNKPIKPAPAEDMGGNPGGGMGINESAKEKIEQIVKDIILESLGDDDE